LQTHQNPPQAAEFDPLVLHAAKQHVDADRKLTHDDRFRCISVAQPAEAKDCTGSRAPVRPQRERPFPSFALAAHAERQVLVVERSFELLTGERPVAVPPLDSAVEAE
jgi:hypothetical protein